MADVSLTVAELETLCQQLTASPRAAVTGYQPSARQVGFFVLVWVAKQQKKQQQRLFQSRADLLAGFDRATLTLHIREVIQQLTLWGEQVTRLKAQDAQEWVLVYKQMEKATKAAAWEQHCSQRTDLIEDALHRAYLKGLLLVRQLFDADVLENSRDIVALVVDHQAALHNAFDFRSGFYPFVRRIAHNELVTLLRGDRWLVDQDFEDLELALPAVGSWQPALCSSADLPPYSYAPVGDSTARQQLTFGGAGAPGMVVVSRPIPAASLDPDKPIVYAPLSVSGLVIGFNVERVPALDAPEAEQVLSGVRIAQLNLTPRLVAKLLSQSYRQQLSIFSQAPDVEWLLNNPLDLDSTLDDARDFFEFVSEVSLDSSGRLLLPSDLRQLVGIRDEVVMVGLQTRVELWPTEAWALRDRGRYSPKAGRAPREGTA